MTVFVLTNYNHEWSGCYITSGKLVFTAFLTLSIACCATTAWQSSNVSLNISRADIFNRPEHMES